MELNVKDMTAGQLLSLIAAAAEAPQRDGSAGARIGTLVAGGLHATVQIKLPNGQVFQLQAEEIF